MSEAPEWLAKKRDWDAWRQTPVGAAFAKFDSACSRYWQADGQDNVSDRRLRELADAADRARSEVIAEIKKLQGWAPEGSDNEETR